MGGVYFPQDLNTMIVSYFFNTSVNENSSAASYSLSKAVEGGFDLTAISSFAGKLNDIYSFLEESGSSDAQEGFRSTILSLSQSLNSEDFTNMIKSFTDLYSNDSGLLKSFFEDVNSINNSGFSSLTGSVVRNFMETYNSFGSNSANLFLEGLNTILNGEGSTLSKFNNFNDFISIWNEALSSGNDTTPDFFSDFISELKEASISGNMEEFLGNYKDTNF